MVQGKHSVLGIAATDLMNIISGNGQSGECHFLTEPGEAILSNTPGTEVPKIGNLLMSQVNQMPCDLAATIHIIMIDGIAVIFCCLVVDYYNRDSIVGELLVLLIAERRGTDDHAIH